jgi:glutamate-1-semialdehyde 2,1-aminomutase
MTGRNVTLTAALEEARERFVAANATSRARYEAARAAMPGGNTRTVLHYSPFPLGFALGEGCRFWDLDGHEYVDLQGEFSAGLYGHSNPAIKTAVTGALEGGIVLGGPNLYEAELATLVCLRFPSVDLVRFTNSGTEANLMAIGTARGVTGRDAIMVFDGAYHGGVLTYAHGVSPVNAPYELVMGRYNDIETTGAAIEANADRLAAVLIEPMMGAGGCVPADPEFLAALRALTEAHGIALIFDEVMTSRLAPGGLQGKLGVTPDLTSLGKYLGGGLSFGAFGGREDWMSRYDPAAPDAFPHAGTFNNNVLTMSAGIAGLSEHFSDDACLALNARGDDLRERLNELGARHGVPFQATGVGSLLNTHFNPEPVTHPEISERDDAEAAELFHLDMIAAGYFLARRGYIALSLPVGDAELDGFVAAVDEFLEARKPVLGAG